MTVITLGLGEFPTGLSGEYSLMDFPGTGDETIVQWQQSQQNFVIISGAGGGGGSAGVPPRVLENPQPGSFQSGIGVISGFVCAATLIEIAFDDGAPFEAGYGTSRGDTQGVCGDTNNGFSLLFNWNLLGDGTHTVRAFADGVLFAEVTITVTTLRLGEFPTGLSGSYDLPNFPGAGDTTSIEWQQSQQNFRITRVIEEPGSIEAGLYTGATSQGTSCPTSFNPSGICHVRFNIASTLDMLSPSSVVDEVFTVAVCGGAPSLLFVSACGTTVDAIIRCTPLPVTDGHWEGGAVLASGSAFDFVADCAGDTCIGTYRLLNTQGCDTGILDWTATAEGGTASVSEAPQEDGKVTEGSKTPKTEYEIITVIPE